MNKKHNAFTIAEVTVVMMAIGIIAALAVATTYKPDLIRQKKILTQSYSFYTAADNVYQQIVFNHSTGAVITGLKDGNADSSVDSNDLVEYFVKYMDGEKYATAADGTANGCDKLKAIGDAATYKGAAKCAMFPPDIIAGFVYNKECNSSVATREFLDVDNRTTRTITGTCGYIIYGFNDSRGVLGEDVFTIPLGKNGVRS